MASSQKENGDAKLNNLLNEQQNSSLLDVFGGEQWLLSNNIVTDASVDTLLGYAYMQQGVKAVRIGLDLDKANDGKTPKVMYEVHLKFWTGLKYSLAKHYASKQGLLNKITALILIKLGAPVPESIENAVKRYAEAYLPEKFSVKIEIK
jgi:hypothetical protein